MSLGMLEILRGGGFTTGGLMFDTKLRRQSIARDDLFHGHIGGMDVMARSLLVAASMMPAACQRASLLSMLIALGGLRRLVPCHSNPSQR